MKSFLSDKELNKGEDVKAHDLREGIFNLIKSENPSFNEDSYISLDELNHYRRQYLSSLITQETGEINALDKDVMDAIKTNSVLSENIEESMRPDILLSLKVRL